MATRFHHIICEEDGTWTASSCDGTILHLGWCLSIARRKWVDVVSIIVLYEQSDVPVLSTG
jgi:hypothetical protein